MKLLLENHITIRSTGCRGPQAPELRCSQTGQISIEPGQGMRVGDSVFQIELVSIEDNTYSIKSKSHGKYLSWNPDAPTYGSKIPGVTSSTSRTAFELWQIKVSSNSETVYLGCEPLCRRQQLKEMFSIQTPRGCRIFTNGGLVPEVPWKDKEVGPGFHFGHIVDHGGILFHLVPDLADPVVVPVTSPVQVRRRRPRRRTSGRARDSPRCSMLMTLIFAIVAITMV